MVIGTLLGIAVVQWRSLRPAVGSLIAGLQTMPSIAWFPLAILLFGCSESAILFVVILGAAPSIATGVITGIDEVPPPLLRAGKMLGARGIDRYRYVVLPAAMPVVPGRAQAGLGVLLAQPARRRAAGLDPAAPRRSGACVSATSLDGAGHG